MIVPMKKKLLYLSVFFLILFTYYSYTVAKEKWTSLDFDTTVRLQDNISRRFDDNFSYLSLLGSAEITVGICIIMAALSLMRLKFLAVLGWSMIVPATLAEVFGKYVLFHPAPPHFLHRSIVHATLPSFYVHTEYSYPSGHMTRTVFIATIFICIAVFRMKNPVLKFLSIGFLTGLSFLMGLTRVYLGEHWMSDVVGGTLLGLGSGIFASILILGKDARLIVYSKGV